MAKSFELIYQGVGSQSGLSVVATVYNELKAVSTTQSGAMVEIGATGKYYKDFSIGAANWSVHVADSAGGKAVKAIGKEVYDVVGIDTQVGTVDTKVIAVQTAVDATKVVTVATLTAVNTVDGKITTVDAKVVAVQTAVDTVNAKVSSLASPPMFG